jgi:hypothetical protein
LNLNLSLYDEKGIWPKLEVFKSVGKMLQIFSVGKKNTYQIKECYLSKKLYSTAYL